MEDRPGSWLQHVPTNGALSLGATRSGIIARGRRDAANSATNPHYRQGVEACNANDYAAAAVSFLRAAEGGHVESQYLLSTLYEAGNGVPQDTTEAARWELQAAEQGHRYAQANVSFRRYTAEEFAEAFAWCQRAADAGLGWAQCNLGLMYRKGEGTAQNDREAAHWFRLAALQDYPEAQRKLADLYSLGAGAPRSYEEAAYWYGKAAGHGDAEAQFQLGHLYDIGLGVDPDYSQYRHWTRQAALQGHEEAIREVKRREYRDP